MADHPGFTYQKPPDGWVCFFCGERFINYGAAEMHFGASPEDRPACRIKLGNERGLVMALRKAQAKLRALLDGDGDIDVRELCPDCGEPPRCADCRYQVML